MNTKYMSATWPTLPAKAICKTMFGAHGSVTEVHMPFDRESGRPRGFCLCYMATPELRRSNPGAKWNLAGERTLTVNEARPREERGVLYGGGGNYGVIAIAGIDRRNSP